MEALITKDSKIGDIVKKYPSSVEVLLGYGVRCVGCNVSPIESLEEGFKSHGFDEATLTDALVKLNEAANAEVSRKQEAVSAKDPSDVGTLSVTDATVAKVKALCEQHNKKGLRIQVKRGGCSGYEYYMELADEKRGSEFALVKGEITVFIDPESLAKLNGSQIDYVDSLQGAGFKVENPNAETTCGCGNSFA